MPRKKVVKLDILDEWRNWRGRVVGYQHHTYCDHERGVCRPMPVLGIEYVIVGGNAANYIRKHSGYPLSKDEKENLLVLVPITRDTDEDSFLMVPREDIIV